MIDDHQYDEKQITRLGKLLSLVLRHQPEQIGIQLDASGWVDVDTLLHQAGKYDIPIDLNTLHYIVETNNKKRFAFSSDFRKIRASQGHSIKVDLGYTAHIPPTFLYHGTAVQFIKVISENGLDKRGRQFVHLSADTQTATNVGQRHGKPVIFKVLAMEMYNEGYSFFLSENGVWLTDHVPSKFLKLIDQES